MANLLWWAYIHASDKSIHLKRFFPTPAGILDDLEYAKEEQRFGNTNILHIVDTPFEASSYEEAFERAKEILRRFNHG